MPPTPAATAQPAYEIPVTVKDLANGMQIIVLQDRSVPLVTVDLAVRNGSFTEPPELNGLSHLYEHMFFKSNHASEIYKCQMMQFSNQQLYQASGCANELALKSQIGDVNYQGELEETGSASNASTREEVVEYHTSTTSPYLATVLHSIRDAVRFPKFDENEFTSEKQVVIGELDRQLSNPYFYLTDELTNRLFYKYPTRKKPGGTRETVAAATTDQMRLIQSRYYVPNNSALIVTGDVDPQTVFTMAEQQFGDWKRVEDPFKKFPLVEHPPLPKSEGIIVTQPVQLTLVAIGWHGPSIGKDDAASYAADVFSFILRQPGSRFQRAMVDSGLANGADISWLTQRNVGPIQATMATSPDKAKAALKAFYTEIANFDKPDYFTDEELANAKTLMEAEDLYGREKLSDYSQTLAFWWSTTGIDYFRGYYAKNRAVTRADIQKYVRTYIQNKPHVAIALLSEEQQAVAKMTPADLTGGAQ
ncbi:MAG TPA: pitrilysin family protein [Pyrinomonadaceae bacterium]|nr:pitrilysin family protein [Pyrinomonadaceae bacterium]